MQDQPGLGEQALDKAVEIGIGSQLDELENLDVAIKTAPLKLIQGQVDDVKIAGDGLVMQKDLRVTQLDMHMTSVAIDPLKAAFGKIELTKPTDASVRAVLTESDINRAFNCDFVRDKLQNLQVLVNGQPTTVSAQQVDFRLPGDRHIALKAILSLPNNQTGQVEFSAIPEVSSNGQTVTLENVEYGEGEELSPELTAALIDQTSAILNLSNFDLVGMSLKIKKLQIDAGKLTIQAEAHLEKFPTA